ncbi:ABC transporter substrate-binding protein [Streptomyces sp. CA-111067]|uniref:ABC transporter substrate-binding protein n=1 Tax=Streptomyces sp. CA-111067 TaxID=3240046 RepID=UPI003D967A36
MARPSKAGALGRPAGRRGVLLPLVLAVTASASLAACGSSGSSSASSSGGTSATKITFGDLSPTTTLTPFYAAVYEGFFKKAGLNVSVEKFTGGGSSSVAALATGAVDIASGGPTNFISDIAKKAVTGKIFAEVAGAQYDVLATKGITSVSQLKGKTIGVSGGNSADEIYLMAVLAKYGIKPGDVTFVTSGTLAQRFGAISSGTIKATAELDTQRTVEQQVGTVVLKAEDSPVQVPNVTFWGSDKFRTSHADALKRMISVLVSSATWVSQPANKAAALADCEKGSGATAASCEQTIAVNTNPAQAGKWTWSSTWAVDTAGIAKAIDATAQVIPEAKGLTPAAVVDTSITGTQP